MLLLPIFAGILTLASAGPVYNQVPAEIYQAMEYHHAQDQQAKGFQGFRPSSNIGYQGQQVVQDAQHHQPIQHQSIQTHAQTAQNQQVQFKTQPQHIQFQSHPQQEQISSHSHHEQYISQPQQFQVQSHHEHLQSQPQHIHVQSHPQHIQFQSQSDHSSHISEQDSHIGHSAESHQNKEAKILNYQHDSDEHNYQYAYETENGIKAQEVGSTVDGGTKTQGAYSYTGDDGQVYTVTYTADENGFHPSGAHLPTPPPMPEEIARSIEHNLREESNGIVDDGQYHHHEPIHEQHTQQSQQYQQKQQPSHGLFQQLQRQNYEQTQQQQPSTVVHQIQQQKQEPIQPQQKQQPSIGLFQQLRQQNLLQNQPQPVVVQQVQQQNNQNKFQQQPQPVAVQQIQQQNHQNNFHQQPQPVVVQKVQQQTHQNFQKLQQPLQHQQSFFQHQKPQNQFQRFQRHQKPIRQQQQVPIAQPQGSAALQQMQPHVEEHRHVEYIIPTFTKTFRRPITDDYMGPVPAPVTEDQY